MARSNFNGLKKVYGDDVTDDVMGCEFHFRQSVAERKRKIGNEKDSDEFHRLADHMLTASSEAAYMAAFHHSLFGARAMAHLMAFVSP